MTLDQPSESSSQAVVVSVHEEMAERAAPTEEAETVEAAMGTMGATAAVTLADNAVDSEELIMPIVVDFDCAVLATDGKATVDISRTGARSTLIREISNLGLGQTSVEWTPKRDKMMAWKTVYELLDQPTVTSHELNKCIFGWHQILLKKAVQSTAVVLCCNSYCTTSTFTRCCIRSCVGRRRTMC